jgi:hypothetical protein
MGPEMEQDFEIPPIQRQDIAQVMRLLPEGDAWAVMTWLSQQGYDVWTVLSEVKRGNTAAFYAPHSPEYVVTQWMSDIRANGGF